MKLPGRLSPVEQRAGLRAEHGMRPHQRYGANLLIPSAQDQRYGSPQFPLENAELFRNVVWPINKDATSVFCIREFIAELREFLDDDLEIQLCAAHRFSGDAGRIVMHSGLPNISTHQVK